MPPPVLRNRRRWPAASPAPPSSSHTSSKAGNTQAEPCDRARGGRCVLLQPRLPCSGRHRATARSHRTPTRPPSHTEQAGLLRQEGRGQGAAGPARLVRQVQPAQAGAGREVDVDDAADERAQPRAIRARAAVEPEQRLRGGAGCSSPPCPANLVSRLLVASACRGQQK